MSPGESGASIDELLDRAVRAINEGDRATATNLASRVLRSTATTRKPRTCSPPAHGEIRRLTIMFADLVDSTALSTRLEPETYRSGISNGTRSPPRSNLNSEVNGSRPNGRPIPTSVGSAASRARPGVAAPPRSSAAATGASATGSPSSRIRSSTRQSIWRFRQCPPYRLPVRFCPAAQRSNGYTSCRSSTLRISALGTSSL